MLWALGAILVVSIRSAPLAQPAQNDVCADKQGLRCGIFMETSLDALKNNDTVLFPQFCLRLKNCTAEQKACSGLESFSIFTVDTACMQQSTTEPSTTSEPATTTTDAETITAETFDPFTISFTETTPETTTAVSSDGTTVVADVSTTTESITVPFETTTAATDAPATVPSEPTTAESDAPTATEPATWFPFETTVPTVPSDATTVTAEASSTTESNTVPFETTTITDTTVSTDLTTAESDVPTTMEPATWFPFETTTTISDAPSTVPTEPTTVAAEGSTTLETHPITWMPTEITTTWEPETTTGTTEEPVDVFTASEVSDPTTTAPITTTEEPTSTIFSSQCQHQFSQATSEDQHSANIINSAVKLASSSEIDDALKCAVFNSVDLIQQLLTTVRKVCGDYDADYAKYVVNLLRFAFQCDELVDTPIVYNL